MAWIEVAMVVLTTGSVVTAGYAAAVARRAQGAAASANTISKDANDVARAANAISSESNDIARRAAEDARGATLDIAWDEMLVALAPMLTLDVYAQPVQPQLTAVRTRLTLLVDRLEGWDRFGEWVACEWRVGLGLGREALERRGDERQPMSDDRILELLHPLHLWAAAFNNNLRLFRREGYSREPVEQLVDVARRSSAGLFRRNAHRGWTEPLDRIPGLSPLAPGE